MAKKLTTEEFTQKARAVHGDTYDYGKVEYVHSRQKVVITCGIHGDFEQTPNNHLTGSGCPTCGTTNRDKYKASQQEAARIVFIDKLRVKNPDLFTNPLIKGVENLQYFGTGKPTKGLVCTKHGPLSPRAGGLLSGNGACIKCAHEVRVKAAQEAHKIPWGIQLIRLQTLHPTIDFSRLTERNYKGVNVKHPVTCKLCGRQWSPKIQDLLKGSGCGCNRGKHRTAVGYLYILKTSYSSHKIGIATNVNKRLQQLRHGAPKASLKPSVVHIVEFPTWDDAYKAEQSLHQFYQGSHIDFSEEYPEGFDGSTEHFNLTPFQVNQATQLAEIMGGKLIK